MSDRILHECGLAVVRLLQPLDWYREARGDLLWGLRRLFLLMEKQHNRGQDGAGIGTVRFDVPPGELFIDRARSARSLASRSRSLTPSTAKGSNDAFRCWAN